MSKSKLKPEDIFFGLQKTYENKNRQQATEESVAVQSVLHPETVQEGEQAQAGERDETVEEQLAKQPTSTIEPIAASKKKRGPAPNPENSRRCSVNVKMSPELKYSAVAIINEMKLRGIKDRYNITDFVTEAVEEKIERAKKQLDME